MPNKDLQGKYFYCPILDKKISYENIKKIKSFFDNYDGSKQQEYENKGGKKMYDWLKKILKTKRDAIYYEKKSRSDAGEENQFIQSHDKNSENGSMIPKAPKIKGLKTVYESNIEKEINKIKYLIEYFNKK